jgi:GT2 family glycosyltransferase
MVVDQGVRSTAREALADLATDSRVRVMRCEEKGKGAALNLGLARAKTELVACTDDDCVVDSEWLAQMASAFTARPEAILAFGNVEPARHDRARGFIPSYRVKHGRVVSRLHQIAGGWGLGACMALRVSAIAALGGFDSALGPGAAFGAAEDLDVVIRAILAGCVIYETTRATVTHFGFRTFLEGRALTQRDWYGIGAVCAKPMRRGHWGVAIIAVHLLLVRTMIPAIKAAVRLQRPRGLRRLGSFALGFGRGFATPMRPSTLLFETGRRTARG